MHIVNVSFLRKLFCMKDKHFTSAVTLLCVLNSTTGHAELSVDDSGRRPIFNPTFFQGADGARIDVSRFSKDDQLDAGAYNVDIYVNDVWVGRKVLTAVFSKQKKRARFCFNLEQISELGVDFSKLSSDKNSPEKLSSKPCSDLDDIAKGIKTTFDSSKLSLSIEVPQAYLKSKPAGYVDPNTWDAGINAGFIDYNLNAFDSDSGGKTQSSYSAGLATGLNLGEWRIRHNGNYNKSFSDHQTYSAYDSISTYAQTDIISMRSQLTLGQYYSNSELFDSVPYTGVQLSSDDRMLPESQRGFAPIIRGIAETNAQVTIRQAGNILYQTTVAPGPFVIDDLNSTGYAGDLSVSVTEASGATRTFIVPYSSAVLLLRPGAMRYNITAGRYRDDNLRAPPSFVQASLRRGLSDTFTGYGGGIVSDKYQAGQVGIAMTTQVGAFGFDVTHSAASFDKKNLSANDFSVRNRSDYEPPRSGNSYRTTYNKLIESTRTNFTVANYRFSNQGYLSFPDFASISGHGNAMLTQRSRSQLDVSQPLTDGWGSIFASGALQTYWDKTAGSDTVYQAGYSNSYRWGTFNASASRTFTGDRRADTQYLLSFSVPIGSRNASYLHSSVTYDENRISSLQSSISGNLGESQNINYGAYVGTSNPSGQRVNSEGFNGQYRGTAATYNGTYSQGKNYNQKSVGAVGSVTIHPRGINFSSEQGETRALVEADGASGARLVNTNSGTVQDNGFGVVTNMMPYRENQISIDPKGISDEVELTMTSQTITPRFGSIVMVKYPTISGDPILLRLKDASGKNLPVGAQVKDLGNGAVSWVGQGGRVFLRAESRTGTLNVSWGKNSSEQCRVEYDAGSFERLKTAFYSEVSGVCLVGKDARITTATRH